MPKKIFLFYSFFLFFGASGFAQDLDRLTEIYYHRDLEGEQFHRMVELELKNLPVDRRGSHRKTAVHLKFLQGLWELDVEQMKEADRYLQLADQETDLWISEEPSSEAYRYRVEIRTMLMMTRGIFYTIANALSLQEYADKALLLDKNNLRAQMIMGIKMLYAPFFLGGDSVRGRSLLLSLANRPEMDRQGRFVAHFEVAGSFYREGKRSLAMTELEKARNYYPRSFIAQKMENLWKKG